MNYEDKIGFVIVIYLNTYHQLVTFMDKLVHDHLSEPE
jgi:hypothetical protein